MQRDSGWKKEKKVMQVVLIKVSDESPQFCVMSDGNSFDLKIQNIALWDC